MTLERSALIPQEEVSLLYLRLVYTSKLIKTTNKSNLMNEKLDEMRGLDNERKSVIDDSNEVISILNLQEKLNTRKRAHCKNQGFQETFFPG